MTHDRWTSGDAELTNALRALYAPPADEAYWDSLESRILAHVAQKDEGTVWWAEVVEMARPGLAAAAALIFAASLALAHSRQVEVSSAYASIIAPVPTSMEASAKAASVGDGDVALHTIISR
ncbi:MAG: hypothetical protein JWM95_2496 [Gemmatimonadetes bacterium]|nr:hypothetical protein [Gemmatimonadota bacterium]